MPPEQPVAPSDRLRTPWAALHATLMPDYNRPATFYWWAVTAVGALVVAWSAAQIAALPLWTVLQIAVGCAAAVLAGLFPVRIPGAKNSFAAGEVFILLVLLMYGPPAAALAAAGENFIGSVRTSKRWTSRLMSPACGALSMWVTGTLLFEILALMDVDSRTGQVTLILLAIVFAILNFALNLILITAVPHLKARRWPTVEELLGNFGWVGTIYAGSAMLAGLMYMVFKTSGVGAMAGAVPLFIVLLVMLHYHFRQRESDAKAQQLRIEAAEREAEQAARHLQQLRESEQRFHAAFSHAAIGMALVTGDGEVLQANPALCELLGFGDGSLAGRHFQDFVHLDDRDALERQWHQAAARQGGDDAIELRCLREGGSLLLVAVHSGHFGDSDAGQPCLILQVQDVTARRDAEARLHHIAYHDSLTSLANRVRFGACLAEAVERCQKEPDYAFAVMYLDFDRFKLINDTLGHTAGDRFLMLVAQRIREQVRPSDTVGRLGGDEFAILVDGLGDDRRLLAMADRLQQALSRPYALEGTEVTSSASIGITFSSMGYTSPGDVLRDADIAMYRAKAAGRARTALFDASLRAQLATQVDLERDLRRALEQEQLELAFQPIYDLATGRVHSFEVLLRWLHPERGFVPPDTFIPIAEDLALIGPLTDWVLAQSCAQLRRFQAHHPAARPPRVHVNVSGTDMCRASFVSHVAAVLLTNGLEPSQLVLEITEGTLMHRLDSALEVMGKLRELGVGLSVDDFGTGYSSLSYLSTLPITSLKIDRSFVRRLQDATSDAEVVKAVVTLGHALGKTVIAEGIETPAQLAQLRALGCELGQGYLLARPLSADRAAATLAAERRWPAPDARASEFDRFVPTSLGEGPSILH